MIADQLITDQLDIWCCARQTRSGTGRGSNGKIDLYGIKKLRQLILELAVRGKLVPQDLNDEPAAELLKRIAAEKAELVKQGKIKKPKPLPEISEEEKPFDLPVGWEWVRLGNLSSKITDGVHHTPKYLNEGVAFISVKDINGNQISFDNCKYISQEQHEEINQRCNPEKGDLLICRIGTLGRVTIVDTDRPFSLFVSVGLIKTLLKDLSVNYLHRAFYSLCLLSQIEEIKVGGSHTNKLNLNDIPNLLIPFPTEKQQKKIVAKIAQLMSLCDQLEQQSLTSMEAHQQLVETLLATLTASQSAEQLAENWARISQHFDILFTSEASIDALKQTILQLAVMGKLVPQNPNDEPASELLKRIAAEKAELVKQGKIKKQKPLPPISDAEKPFELPQGWEWVRLGFVTNYGECDKAEPTDANEDTWIVELEDIEKSTSKLLNRVNFSERPFKSSKNKFNKNDVLYGKLRPYLDKVLVADDSGLCTTEIIPIKVYGSILPDYLRILLKSPGFIAYANESTHGMNLPRLGTDKAIHAVVGLTAIAEQVRIVNKVDELISLCDQLKSHLQSTQQTQLSLADALTDAALN